MTCLGVSDPKKFWSKLENYLVQKLVFKNSITRFAEHLRPIVLIRKLFSPPQNFSLTQFGASSGRGSIISENVLPSQAISTVGVFKGERVAIKKISKKKVKKKWKLFWLIDSKKKMQAVFNRFLSRFEQFPFIFTFPDWSQRCSFMGNKKDSWHQPWKYCSVHRRLHWFTSTLRSHSLRILPKDSQRCAGKWSDSVGLELPDVFDPRSC